MPWTRISATIVLFLIAASVQDVAFARGAGKYLNTKVTSYSFKRHPHHVGANTFTDWPLSAIYNGSAKAQFRTQRQRALNENSFITQELNIEGYPMGIGVELKRFSDQ